MTDRDVPNAMLLEDGAVFVTRLMTASDGQALPRHKASVESVIVVIEGECAVALRGADHTVKSGTSLIIPADEWHQIVAQPTFQAVHVMPREIRFEFAT